MKFKDMQYARPDIDVIKGKVEGLIKKFNSAGSFEEADMIFLETDRLCDGVATMRSISFVRHQINTEDEFYDKEIAFFDENMPVLQESLEDWNKTVASSGFRPELERKYGRLMFLNIDMTLKAFSPEIVPDMQEENRLTTEYSKLIASAQIPFEGEVYTIAQIGSFKLDPDDSRRLAAWKAEAGFYVENGERLDGIFGELVALRDKMAKTLGLKDYVEMAYCLMQRNCYTREDVEKFRSAVVEYIVPVAADIYKKQAERLDVSYPMNFADAALEYRSGNPKPFGTPEEILAHGRKFYHELSTETEEFIDFLFDNELLDVLSRKGKAAGGFCESIPGHKSPFIFANFNGTAHDVEVMTHEAGHAFADYVARDIVPSDNRHPGLESCEIHSMSMEFFAWPWCEGFFGKDTDKFYYSHLAGALTFIPYGTMVDHFQHIMYEKPELSPDERHGVWKELLGTYMPWMKLGEIPFYGDAKGWQRQLHIYMYPFYYIDYCLAQCVALQFWALMQKDRDKAWKSYLTLVGHAGAKTYTELVASANLETPFGDGALRTISEAARAWLADVDMEKLK